MFTEESGTGFFAKMKSVFSATEKSANEETTTTETVVTATNDVVSERPTLYASLGNVVEETTTNNFVEPVFTYTSRVSDESVTEKEIALRTVEVTAPTYAFAAEKDLDIRFATKFIQGNGKFIYCESMKEAVDGLRMLKAERNWSHIFCWENEIKDAFCESNFQKGSIGYTIENSDAAISLCESLVAEDGTIILNPKQASRRRLHCFPKTHIIITDVAHLAPTEAEGLERFYALNKGELPSIIKLGSCNDGHFYDKQRLILNAEGTEDVYVILVDQVIPPSLRP